MDPLVGTRWRGRFGDVREVTAVRFFDNGRIQVKWRAHAANGHGYGGSDAPWAWKRWAKHAEQIDPLPPADEG